MRPPSLLRITTDDAASIASSPGRLRPRRVERRRVHQLGQAEVEQLDLAGLGEDRVGQLDVAVEHAVAVRRRQPAAQADRQLEHLARRQRHLDLAEVLAADVLGNRGTGGPRADRRGRSSPRWGAGSAPPRGPRPEALAVVARRGATWPTNFTATGAVEHRVVGQVRPAHAALAEQADQPVLVERGRRLPLAAAVSTISGPRPSSGRAATTSEPGLWDLASDPRSESRLTRLRVVIAHRRSSGFRDITTSVARPAGARQGRLAYPL